MSWWYQGGAVSPSVWVCLQSLAVTPEPAQTPHWWRWPQTLSSCRLFLVPWLRLGQRARRWRSPRASSVRAKPVRNNRRLCKSESSLWREERNLFLICRRKPEYQEKTHTERIQLLSTAQPCSPICQPRHLERLKNSINGWRLTTTCCPYVHLQTDPQVWAGPHYTQVSILNWSTAEEWVCTFLFNTEYV